MTYEEYKNRVSEMKRIQTISKVNLIDQENRKLTTFHYHVLMIKNYILDNGNKTLPYEHEHINYLLF